jgi:hypothetical protein
LLFVLGFEGGEPFQCYYLKHVEANEKIPLKWILMRQDVRMRGGWNWLRIVTNGSPWHSDVEPSCYMSSATDPCLIFMVLTVLLTRVLV